MLFIKNGYFYINDKSSIETNEQASKTGWYIISQFKDYNINENTNDKLNDIIKYSKCWNNINNYQCSYDDFLMDKVKNMENNMYISSSNFKH